MLILNIDSNGKIKGKDLGYLLHKNPDTAHNGCELSTGNGYFFYSHIGDFSCEANILYKPDIIEDETTSYVTDQEYVDGFGLSRSISKLFSSTLNSKCIRPEYLDIPLTLNATIGPIMWDINSSVEELFKPCGINAIEKESIILSDLWDSKLKVISLSSDTLTLSSFLSIIATMLCIIDKRKNTYIDEDDVARLIRLSSSWIKEHPLQKTIIQRYLRLSSLINQAYKDLDINTEHKKRLQDDRIDKVFELLKNNNTCRVLDMGCGEGDLVMRLLGDAQFSHIIGIDPSVKCLQKIQKRIEKHTFIPLQLIERLDIHQGSGIFPDKSWDNADVVTLIEVIEHMELDAVEILKHKVFSHGFNMIIITTPNKEWNASIDLKDNEFRHHDHRFEMTGKEFNQWIEDINTQYNYKSELFYIGEKDEEYGYPTQGCVFRKY